MELLLYWVGGTVLTFALMEFVETVFPHRYIELPAAERRSIMGRWCLLWLPVFGVGAII